MQINSVQYSSSPSWTLVDDCANEYLYYQIKAIEHTDGGSTITDTVEIVLYVVPASGDEPHVNNKPVALIQILSPHSGLSHDEGVLITFDGSQSFDPDGDDIQAYEWAFGDGGTDTVETAAHTYYVNENKTFEVTLRVQDEHGKWSNSADIDLNIRNIPEIEENKPPKAVLKYTQLNEYAPVEIEFDGSESSDSDGDKLSYALIFGDGEAISGDDVSELDPEHKKYRDDAIHTYKVGGIYYPILTVFDGEFAAKDDHLTISIDEYDHHGGPGNGGPGDGEPGDGDPSVGVPNGVLIFETTRITLDAGEQASIPIKIMNLGNGAAEYEIEIVRSGFGTASASPSKFDLGAENDMRCYIKLRADDDAEGKYSLKINLLQNGKVVDTKFIYVEVEQRTSAWAIFGMAALLIIALAGVAGLAYLVYKETSKQNEKKAQAKLEKYY